MNDFFDNHWFYWTKRLACNVGQWPFQSRKWKTGLRIFCHLVPYSGLPAFILGFIVLWREGKLEAVVQSFPPIITLFDVGIKYNQYTYNEMKVKQLFRRVEKDWTMITGIKGQARDILEKYANIGRTTATFYAMYLYISMVIFLLLPNIPMLLDIIKPLNESRPVRLLYPIAYGKYTEKYRHFMSAHAVLGTIIIINNVIACDSMYIPLCCHGCGLFAVVGYVIATVLVRNRLNCMCDPSEIERIEATESIFEYHDKDMANWRNNMDKQEAVIRSCVKLHDRALWYFERLDSCYSGNFLINISLNMVIISITGLQIIIKLDDWEQLTTGIIYLLAQLLHLFFLILPGQLMMDTSSSVGDSAYSGSWYNLPANIQKLLILIILRSGKPCVLSAGSFFLLTMETFMSVVQSAMSYLTVLTNFY